MKLFMRALSVCLAMAMVFSGFMMPTAHTKASAAELNPGQVAGQTVSVSGGELHPFTSTEALIRDAIEELRLKNLVASDKKQDAAFVAAVEEASDLSYEAAKSTIAAALKDGMSLGQIDVSDFGLSKEHMSKLMHEVLRDYYLYNAVSELTYTTEGNKVTKVGFTVSEGFTAALDAVNASTVDLTVKVDSDAAINTAVLQPVQNAPVRNDSLAVIDRLPGGNQSTVMAETDNQTAAAAETGCTMHVVSGEVDIDFNADTYIDVGDVVAFRKQVANSDDGAGLPDFNGDGYVDVGDVVALRKHVADPDNFELQGVGGTGTVTFTWAEYQDYSPVFYMDAEGYYLDADGNRRFRMDPETGVLYNEAGQMVYQPVDAEGNYVDASGNPAQPFNDSIANGGLLYNPASGEITTGLLPNIYYKLSGISFHCSKCRQDITLVDDPETAVDELADFSQTQDIWVNMVTGALVAVNPGEQPVPGEGETIDMYMLYTDMQVGFYYDDTFGFLTNPETGELITDENGDPIPMYVMDEQGNPILDEQGNVQVIGLYTSKPQDNGTAEFMYYYSVLSAFNADHAEYFGVSTDYWTSKNTESTPIGAILSLCNMDPATPIVPAQMLMLVQMLPQAFMAYVYFYGAELLAVRDAAMAAVDALPKDATTIQKMLVIHDWLAENAVFDMGSMLNVSDTGGNSDPIQMTTFGAMLSNQLTTIQNSNYYGGICLAYAAAYAYLVQCAFPEIYQVSEFVDSDGDGENDTKVTRWATPKEVDLNGGDIVDFSQVMFYTDTRESSVAGEGFGGGAFNNVHYFNAVQIPDAHEDPTHREENMSMSGGMGGTSQGDYDQVGKWFYVDACYDDIYVECLSQYRVEAEGSVYHTYFLVSPQTMGKLWDSSIDYIDSPYDGYTYVIETDAEGNPVVSDNIDEYIDEEKTEKNPNYDPEHPNYVKVVAENETKNHNTSYETSWFSGAVSKIYFDGENWYYVDGGQSASSQTAMIDENGDVNIDFGDTGMDFESLSHSSRVDKNSQDQMKIRPMDAPDWWEEESSNNDNMGMGSMMSSKEDTYATTIFDYGTGETGNGEAVAEALAAAIEEDFVYTEQFPGLTHTIGLVEDTIFFNLGNQIWTLNVGTKTVENTAEDGTTTSETLVVGENVTLFKEYNTVTASSDGRPFKGSSYVIDPEGTALTVHNNPIAALCVRDNYIPLYNYYDADGNLVMDFEGNISDAYMQKLMNGTMSQDQLMAAIVGRVFVAMAAVPTMTVNIATNWSFTAAFTDEMTEDEKNASMYTKEAFNFNPEYTLGLSDETKNSNKEFLWCANIREDVALSDWEASVGGTDNVPCTAQNVGHTYAYNEAEGVFVCSACKLHAFNIVGETEHADVILTAVTSSGISDDFMSGNGYGDTDTTVFPVSPQREGAVTQDTIDIKVVVEEGYGLPELTYTLVGVEVEEEETPVEGEGEGEETPDEGGEETPDEGGEETPDEGGAAVEYTVVLTESEEEPGVYTGTITKDVECCVVINVTAVPAEKLTVEEAENGVVTVVTGEPEVEEEETPAEGEDVAPAAELTINEGETAEVKVGDEVTINAVADEGYTVGTVKYSYIDPNPAETTAEGDEETGDGESTEGDTTEGDTTEGEGGNTEGDGETETPEEPVYIDVVLVPNEDGTYTFEMPAVDVIVTVEFNKLYAIAAVIDAEKGAVEVADTAVAGEDVKVVVTPVEGFLVNKVYATYEGAEEMEIVNAVAVAGEENAYIFEMPAADVELHVTFTEDTSKFNITVTELDETVGTVETDKTKAAEDDIVTVTVTLEEGYVIDKVVMTYEEVTGEGEEAVTNPVEVTLLAEEDGVYTFEMPAADVTVTVSYKKIHTITVAEIPEAEGTATVDKETSLAGETVVLTVTPAEGFEIDTVSAVYDAVTGTGDDAIHVETEMELTDGVDGTYAFEMPDGDVTITVTFKAVTPDPENPENPDPENPENPDPENPENPDPENPENPDPENPENPDPENPETPENPDPEQPAQPEELTYEEYLALTPEEQQAYMESFESEEAFFEWYNAAKAKYEEENPPIDVGDGSVDMGDIVGGGN